jgi:hypothetical protein
MDRSHFAMLGIGLLVGAASLGASSDQLDSTVSNITDTVAPTYPDTDLRNVMDSQTKTKNVTIDGKVTETYQRTILSDKGYKVELKQCGENFDIQEGSTLEVKGEYMQAVTSNGERHYLKCTEPPRMLSR